MNKDAHLIFENYTKINEAAAAAPAQPEVRLKDLNAFNNVLNAIDEFENKASALMKTELFKENESAQAKQVIGGTISAFLQSLVSVTAIKNAQEVEQMKKSISSKIKDVDVTPILQILDSRAQQLQPQAPTQVASQPSPATGAPAPQTPAVPPAQTPTAGS